MSKGEKKYRGEGEGRIFIIISLGEIVRKSGGNQRRILFIVNKGIN